MSMENPNVNQNAPASPSPDNQQEKDFNNLVLEAKLHLSKGQVSDMIKILDKFDEVQRAKFFTDEKVRQSALFGTELCLGYGYCSDAIEIIRIFSLENDIKKSEETKKAIVSAANKGINYLEKEISKNLFAHDRNLDIAQSEKEELELFIKKLSR